MTRSRPILQCLLVTTVLFLLLAACGTGGKVTKAVSGVNAVATHVVPVEHDGSYTDVDPSGLASMLESKDFRLINVHVPYEGEIDRTDSFIPWDEIDAQLGQLPTDMSAKLVVYCRSGGMSAIAARTLVKVGYTAVWNLDGGMIAWEQAGYPLVDAGRGGRRGWLASDTAVR